MRDLTYPPIIAACKLGFRALGQRITVTGTEHVPRSGGVLIAVNHIGYVDFVYGGLAVNPAGRRVRFMSKRELFDHRVTGPLMRSLHHIEVDRAAGEASYRTAVDFLRAGECVGIFPEATISRAMELKEFKLGAVRIAADAGVPVFPVVLWGTQRLMTKDHPKDFPARPSHPHPGRRPAASHRGRPGRRDRRAADGDGRHARRRDRRLPRRAPAARQLVGAATPRWQRADPRGGGGARHGGEARACRPPLTPAALRDDLSLCRQIDRSMND